MLVLCLFCSIQLMKQSGNENLILTLKLNSKKCFLSIFHTRWFLSSSEDRSSVRLLVFKTDVDRLTERRLACNSLELLPRNNIIFRYNNHSLGKSAEQLIMFCADWELFNVMDVRRYIKTSLPDQWGSNPFIALTRWTQLTKPLPLTNSLGMD